MKPLVTLSLLAFWCGVSVLSAQTFSDVYGVMRVPLTADADNHIGVPFRQEATLVAPVQSRDGAGTLIFDLPQPLTPNAFAGSHYVRINEGSDAGKYFMVTANTADSVSLDTLGDPLSGLHAGTQVSVVKCWTLGELLPAASQTAIQPSNGNLSFQRGSEVLLPDVEGSGVNRSPKRVFFVTTSRWVEDAPGFPTADNVVLLPDSFLIIRQKASAGERNFVTMGAAETGPLTSFIYTSSTGREDNYLFLGNSTSTPLSQLNFGTSFTSSIGTLPFQRRDELLIWTPNNTGTNKSPSRLFFRVGSVWREDAPGYPVADAFVLEPTMPFVIRKYQQSPATTVTWTQEAEF